jgi:hypothetical protein
MASGSEDVVHGSPEQPSGIATLSRPVRMERIGLQGRRGRSMGPGTSTVLGMMRFTSALMPKEHTSFHRLAHALSRPHCFEASRNPSNDGDVQA